MGLAFLLAWAAGGGAMPPLLTAQEEPEPPTPAATIAADNRQPAAASQYTVAFTAAANLPPGSDQPIILTLHEDIGVPPGINPQAVRITASHLADMDGTARGSGSGPPLDLALSGHTDPRDPTVITLFLGDLSPSDGLQQIAAGAEVSIIFSVRAGLSNPAEGGRFSWTVQVGNAAEPIAAAHPDPLVRQAFGEPAMPATADDLITGLLVDREVVLSSPSGRPGDGYCRHWPGFQERHYPDFLAGRQL